MGKVLDLSKHLDEILEMRNNKISIRKIAKKFQCSHPIISEFLKKYNQNTQQFKHQFDKDFFKLINSQEKAYCLGLMISDGYVQYGRIGITMTDLDVIEKFKQALKYDGDIRILSPTKPHHKMKYEVNIYSVEMFNDIAKYGIVPNKSLIIKFPQNELIPNDLLPHLIRGIFDGDGCIGQYKDKQWKIVFTGTKELLEGIHNLSPIKGKFGYAGGKSGSNTWQWRIRKLLDIQNFICWMYKDAAIYMNRKKIMADRCLPAKDGFLDNIMFYLNSYGFNFIKDSELSLTIKDTGKNYVIEYINFSKNNELKYCYRQKRYFKAHGWNYLCIFEDEWIQRPEQVKDFILAKLGYYEKRIFARKCDIKEIDKTEAIQFICNNHIQKVNNGGIINIGLTYESVLVGLCQLRKHHRNSVDITISRICFTKGTQVVGGFSRLIKKAVLWCKENGYSELITWSDNRLTNGDSYEQAGFIKSKEYKSDYSYIHPDKPSIRINKQLMQKKKLKVPEGFTENEWTKKLGYTRLWDCGKTKFVYHI